MFQFKEKISDKLIDKICPIGEKALTMCEKEEDRLLEILDQGSKTAASKADKTLAAIKAQVGILRRNI